MSLSSFYSSNSSSNNRLNLNSKSNNQNPCYTLPITCQICLGKVKEPCVCPNLHAFCSFCIDIWLEKTKQCPTCRIAIDKENPCRRILGGIENLDDVDLIKPTEFSHPSTRKARYLNMFQQYEDEINRLNSYIDSLNDEITKLKESGKIISQNVQSSSSPQHDMIQILKSKLQTTQSSLDEVLKERDNLKEENKKLDSENSILIQDIARLKASLNEKNSQLTSKYTMAALESKLECYEKEIKQLQKALEKSDKYIAELEFNKKELKNKENKQSDNGLVSNSLNVISSIYSSSTNNVKYGSPFNSIYKNDSKCVKFLDSSPPNLSLNSQECSATKKGVISNNRFYGSPSKTPVQTTPSKTNISTNVTSFNERLKKNLFNTNTISSNSFDLEAPSSFSQSMISINNTNQNNNILLSNSTTNLTNQSHNFLFSPMKRLRLEEVNLEKPDDDDKQTFKETNYKLNSILNQNRTFNLNNKTEIDNNSISEFNDCIELLNQAEKKVQNRQISPNNKKAEFNSNFANCKYLLVEGSSSSISSQLSNESTVNSLSATITTGASSLVSSSNSSDSFSFNQNLLNQNIKNQINLDKTSPTSILNKAK